MCVCASPPHPTDHRGEDHFDMAVGEDSWNQRRLSEDIVSFFMDATHYGNVTPIMQCVFELLCC